MRPTVRLSACLLAVSVLLSGCGKSDQSGIDVAKGFNVVRYQEAKRKPAPAFTGELLQPGSRFDSARFADKVAVVNFWGSWCGPCRREQPHLEALWQRYATRGVVFLGVNTRRDQKAAAAAFLDEFDVTYPSVFDPDSRVAHQFAVRFMPATYVIDLEGRIAAQITGALRSQQDLAAVLDEELRRKAAS